MKKMFLKFSICFLALVLTFSFTSCKKHKEEPDDTALQMADADDEAGVAAESDASLNDANMAFSQGSATGARISASTQIAGATIDTSKLSAEKKITITYNGVSGVKIKVGTVIAQLTSGEKWSDINAVLTVNFNYTVTRNNKTWNLSGTHYVTNITGGLIKNLSGSEIIVHTVRGMSQITFEDNLMRTWHVYKKRTFTTDAGYLKISLEGDTAVNGVDHVEKIGVNRRGVNFYVQIQSPIIWTSECYLIIGGIKVHKGVERELTVTGGVDREGNDVKSCAAYGFRLNWVNEKGAQKQTVISY